MLTHVPSATLSLDGNTVTIDWHEHERGDADGSGYEVTRTMSDGSGLFYDGPRFYDLHEAIRHGMKALADHELFRADLYAAGLVR